ncbi:carbohydrate ABC transporter permease [Arthrobacter sp. SA17]
MTTHSLVRGTRRKRWQGVGGGSGAFYAFISPWLIGTVLLTLFPLGYALWISFTNWDGISPSQNWVGLENYTDALADPQVWASLQRTGVLALVIVPITICGGLGLALLLNEKSASAQVSGCWSTCRPSCRPSRPRLPGNCCSTATAGRSTVSWRSSAQMP